ncbi:MAG: hypothetical protein LBR77_00085, partial [Lachnospiraceae bacterium]|nr:hypothetical protein [Lachnospiraceae bacterium]
MARQRDTCWLAKQVGIGGRGGAVPTYRLPAPEPGNQADQMIHDAIASEMQALFGGIQATGGEEATVRFSLMDGGVPSPPDASYMPTPTGRRPIANLGSPESADPRIADAYRIEKAPSGFHVSGRTFRALLYGMFGLHRILAVSGGAAAPYFGANPTAAAKHDAAAKPSAAANPVAAAAPDAAVKHDAVAANPFAFPHESAPRHPIRMLNHWDNFDGSIERGYAGDSIFFDRNAFRGDLGLLRGYARLL